MKISEELLTRYALGECTAEEKALVERWLNTSENLDTVPYRVEFGPVKKRIWTRLEQWTVKPDRYRIGRLLMRYSAAACLLLGVLGISVLWGDRYFATETHFENMGALAPKKVIGEGVAFKLMPESKVAWTTSSLVSQNKLSVCGNAILSSLDQGGIDIQITSSCSGKSPQSRAVRLNKDDLYVLNDQTNGDRLIVFDSEELNSQHPVCRARVNAIFQQATPLKI